MSGVKMKIAFTSDSRRDLHWARYVSRSFHCYKSCTCKSYPKIDKRVLDSDVWFLGSFDNHVRRPFTPAEEEIIDKFKGVLICFQSDDAIDLFIDRFSPELLGKVDFWLQRAFHDEWKAPATGKEVFLPPFIPATLHHKTREIPYASRGSRIVFFGAATGSSDPGENTRFKATGILKERFGEQFVGGIFENLDNPGLRVPERLKAAKIGRYSHLDLLAASAIGLSLPGNSPLTFRHIECLAAGTLCLSSGLGEIRWMDGGLEPGIHYVDIPRSLEGFADTVAALLDDTTGSAKIADAGKARYSEYLKPNSYFYNELLFEDFCDQFDGALALKPNPAKGLVSTISTLVQPLHQSVKEYRVNKREQPRR